MKKIISPLVALLITITLLPTANAKTSINSTSTTGTENINRTVKTTKLTPLEYENLMKTIETKKIKPRTIEKTGKVFDSYSLGQGVSFITSHKDTTFPSTEIWVQDGYIVLNQTDMRIINAINVGGITALLSPYIGPGAAAGIASNLANGVSCPGDQRKMG